MHHPTEHQVRQTSSRGDPAPLADQSSMAAYGQLIGCALAPPIKREEILWIVKESHVDWERRRLGISEEKALKALDEMAPEEADRIRRSHFAQKEVQSELRSVADTERLISASDLTPERLSGVKLLIAVGGDDHFKRVSHSVPSGVMVMGLNSDPRHSKGALLSGAASDLEGLVSRLERGLYAVQEWGRLSLTVNGTEVGPAMADIVLGKSDFRLMSRHVLTFNDKSVEQRSSGLLFSSGAGSTGWFSSAGMYLGSGSRAFARTAPFVRWELREPGVEIEDGKPVLPELCEGTVMPGEKVTVVSRNNSDGIISRDSLDEIPFPRGTIAEIYPHPEPLRVVVPVVCP